MAILTPSAIPVGSTGRVLVAPLATAYPADASAAFGVTWKELGSITTDGITGSAEKSFEEIRSWQTKGVVRYIPNEANLSVSFQAQEWNEHTMSLFWGSEAVAAGTGSAFPISSISATDERAFALEFQDGSVVWRLHMPRAQVTETGDWQINAENVPVLEMTVSALVSDGTDELARWVTTLDLVA